MVPLFSDLVLIDNRDSLASILIFDIDNRYQQYRPSLIYKLNIDNRNQQYRPSLVSISPGRKLIKTVEI